MYIPGKYHFGQYCITFILSHTTTHTNHTLHPIKPHSIFIQNTNKYHGKNSVYLEMPFCWTVCLTFILSHITCHSNHTLHPIKPHSIFIQKRTDTRAEIHCIWKMFFLTICVTCILFHTTTHSNYTLHPITPHSISIPKRTDTKAETRCIWKMPFFLESMCYRHFVSQPLTQIIPCIQSNQTLYS